MSIFANNNDSKKTNSTALFKKLRAAKELLEPASEERLLIGSGEVLRIFLCWNESAPASGSTPARIRTPNVNLDLMAGAAEPGGTRCVARCDAQRPQSRGMTHGGDATSAPNGAVEHIDFDLGQLPATARLISVGVRSVRGHLLSEIPEVFVGVQLLEPGPLEGELQPAGLPRIRELHGAKDEAYVGYLDVAARAFIWGLETLEGVPTP